MIAIGHALLYNAVALWLLTGAGNTLCRHLFSLTGMRDAIAHLPPDALPVGRVVGWLERLILAAGIVANSWEVIAAVIALKTVARFKNLDEKVFAEYFLVGSLFSLFWAILVSGAWMAYDHAAGYDLRHAIVTLTGVGSAIS